MNSSKTDRTLSFVLESGGKSIYSSSIMDDQPPTYRSSTQGQYPLNVHSLAHKASNPGWTRTVSPELQSIYPSNTRAKPTANKRKCLVVKILAGIVFTLLVLAGIALIVLYGISNLLDDTLYLIN